MSSLAPAAAAALRPAAANTEAEPSTEKKTGNFLSRLFHREANEKKRQEILQILKDALPPILEQMVTQDKYLITPSGAINPVFYQEELEGISNDLDRVDLGNGVTVLQVPDSKFKTVTSHLFIEITEVEVKGFTPWAELFDDEKNKEFLPYAPLPVPSQKVQVVSITASSYGESERVFHFIKERQMAGTSKEAVEGYFEMSAYLEFWKKSKENIQKSDPNDPVFKLYVAYWKPIHEKREAYQVKHKASEYGNPYNQQVYEDFDFGKHPLVEKAEAVKFLYRVGHAAHEALGFKATA